jgi:hypothetical protein
MQSKEGRYYPWSQEKNKNKKQNCDRRRKLSQKKSNVFFCDTFSDGEPGNVYRLNKAESPQGMTQKIMQR